MFVVRYRYEDLGDDEFQQLVQALLGYELGYSLRAMPLGKADGGRDAVHHTAVFQVKFTNARVSNARSWLRKALNGEASRIRALAERGMRNYFLVTNVAGTAGLDVGSIDRLHNDIHVSQQDFGVNITVWWRDDVDTRMRYAPNAIVRSFPRVFPSDHEQLVRRAIGTRSGTVRVGMPPERARHFQHRTESVALAQMLSSDDSASRSVVISGMGGIGKTQVAADYALSAWRDRQIDVLVWLVASSSEAIVTGYASAAVEAGVDCGRTGAEAAELFRNWLDDTDTRWLIVMDDVTDANAVHRWWPPISNANGRVIATTRLRDNAIRALGAPLALGLFTPAESLAYLDSALHGGNPPDTATTAEAAALADDLGHLPIGLAQAAAYTVNKRLTYGSYRQRFADHRRAMPAPGRTLLPDGHGRTVAGTLSLSVAAADELDPAGLASVVLGLASLLHPDGIPLELFTAGSATAYLNEMWAGPGTASDNRLDNEQISDALTNLALFHAVDIDGSLVRVHALTQRAATDSMIRQQRAVAVRAAASALLEIWPGKETDVAYSQTLRINAALLRCRFPEPMWTPEPHPVLFREGASLGSAYQLTAAVDHYGWMYAESARRYGVSDPHTLHAAFDQAQWRGESGDSAGASQALEELLPLQTASLGAEHPEVLHTRRYIAWYCGQSGDPAEALKHAESLLADQIDLLGPDHEDTLTTRMDVAWWRGQAQDPALGAQQLDQLIPNLVRFLGPDHEATLIARSSAARLHGEAGDFLAAASGTEQVLADEMRVHGPRHRNTLISRHDLAMWRAEAGEPENALDELVLLLPEMQEILGPEHPDILAVRVNIARWLAETGRVPEAIDIRNSIVGTMERVLGPDHVDTLDNRLQLAYQTATNDDLPNAAGILNQLIPDLERVLGSGDERTEHAKATLEEWTREGGHE